MKKVIIISNTPIEQSDRDFILNLRVISNLDSSSIKNSYDVVIRDLNSLEQKDLYSASVIIFNRAAFFSKAVLPLLKAAAKSGIGIIYDIDDYLLEVPAYSASNSAYRSNMSLFVKNMRFADVVTVSTADLASEMKAYSSNIIVVPNTLEFRKLPKRKDSATKPVRILLSSGDNLKIQSFRDDFLKVISDVKKRYINRVEIILVGRFDNLKTDDSLFDKNYHHMRHDEYDKFLYELDADIALVPLAGKEDSETYRMHRCKSNIKFLENAQNGICGIYSRVEPYLLVENMSEGLVVENSYEAWFGALCSLIDNEKLREKIRENAYKKAVSAFSKEVSQRVWLQLLDKAAMKENQKCCFSSRLISSHICFMQFKSYIFIKKAIRFFLSRE